MRDIAPSGGSAGVIIKHKSMEMDIDKESQERIDVLVEKSVLNSQDRAFLKARRDYLTAAQVKKCGLEEEKKATKKGKKKK